MRRLDPSQAKPSRGNATENPTTIPIPNQTSPSHRRREPPTGSQRYTTKRRNENIFLLAPYTSQAWGHPHNIYTGEPRTMKWDRTMSTNQASAIHTRTTTLRQKRARAEGTQGRRPCTPTPLSPLPASKPNTYTVRQQRFRVVRTSAAIMQHARAT